MMRFAQLALMLILLAGCTVIRIENAAKVQVRLVAGTIRILPEPGATDIVSYRVRGFGIVPTQTGVTLGWAAEDAVLLQASSKCQVVIFELPSQPEAAHAWRDLIGKRENICLVGETLDEKNSH